MGKEEPRALLIAEPRSSARAGNAASIERATRKTKTPRRKSGDPRSPDLCPQLKWSSQCRGRETQERADSTPVSSLAMNYKAPNYLDYLTLAI